MRVLSCCSVLFSALLLLIKGLKCQDCDKDSQSDNPLLNIFLNYDEDPGFDRFLEYAEHYHRHLNKFRSKTSIKMLEIGVQSGGSTRAWKKYFGESMTYIGIDINPRCKAYESQNEKIFIEIGSQLDQNLLSELCRKYGPFDVVIDDGSHSTIASKASLDGLWDCVAEDGIYAIEDTWSMSVFRHENTKQYMQIDNLDLFGILGKMLRQQVSYFDDWFPTGPAFKDPDPMTSSLYSTTVYDGMILLQKRNAPFRPLTEIKRGKTFIPY